jgi:hypothetical protein
VENKTRAHARFVWVGFGSDPQVQICTHTRLSGPKPAGHPKPKPELPSLPASHQSLADQPCLAFTQPLLSSSTSSCSYYAHSTDQKYQKESKFLSSFSKVLFIIFLKFLILYYAMMK